MTQLDYLDIIRDAYFKKPNIPLDGNKASFIINNWTDIASEEANTKNPLTQIQFLKKYKLRLKLVRP